MRLLTALFMRSQLEGYITCTLIVSQYTLQTKVGTLILEERPTILDSRIYNKYLQVYSFEALNSSVLM